MPETMCHSEVIKSRGKCRDASNEHRLHPKILLVHLPLVAWHRELQQSKTVLQANSIHMQQCNGRKCGVWWKAKIAE